MLKSAAVNCVACTRATRRGSCASTARKALVVNTLTRVAAKRIALTRHARGRAGATAAPLLEGVAEGGGESVESGTEAGIDGSYVGVQPELSTGKCGVVADFDRLGEVESAVP